MRCDRKGDSLVVSPEDLAPIETDDVVAARRAARSTKTGTLEGKRND